MIRWNFKVRDAIDAVRVLDEAALPWVSAERHAKIRPGGRVCREKVTVGVKKVADLLPAEAPNRRHW